MSKTPSPDPRLTPLAASLPQTVPFVGPEAQERASAAAFLARLGANESVFGPSPHAIEALSNAAHDIWMYGDPESYDLRNALANHHQISPHNIVVGAGIDGLLDSLVRLTVASGTPVVTSSGAYPTFNYHVVGYGGVLHQVPYRNDCEDLEALLAKAKAVGAKLIYLANPDNPMGTYHSAEQIEHLIARIPENCLLVLDEAYIELAPKDAAPAIDIFNPNVIRMRTFSKAYGMAGARVGYAMGPLPLIKAFDTVRNHFGMSRASQAAALSALRDQSWLIQVQEKVDQARRQITKIASDNGLTALPSATNFVAIDCGKDGVFARAVLQRLIQQRIFVRMPFVAPQDRCIRVSCGREDDLDHFARALPKALAAARDGPDKSR